MNEEDRLCDTGGDDPGAALLRSAKGYRLSEETRQRAFATVGLAVGANALVTGKAAAKGMAAGTKAIGLALAGIVAVLASVGAYRALTPGDQTPSPSATSVTVAVPPRGRVEPPATPQAPENPAPAAPSASASATPRLGVSSPGTRIAAPANLQGELAALDAASNAVARGDAPRALALLDAYGRDFPRGSLGTEATMLRAEALERAGRHTEAAQLARAFLKRYPKSLLADRMRQIAAD